VLAGEMHREARACRSPGYSLANTFMSNLNAINRFHFTLKDRAMLFARPHGFY